MSVLVRRASGLLELFDVPELSIDASIGRSCELGASGLLVPKQPEYLPTYPLPGFIVGDCGPFIRGNPGTQVEWLSHRPAMAWQATLSDLLGGIAAATRPPGDFDRWEAELGGP